MLYETFFPANLLVWHWMKKLELEVLEEDVIAAGSTTQKSFLPRDAMHARY